MKRHSISSRPSDLTSELAFASILHPTQFRDLWNGDHRSPERALAAAVLEGATEDLLKHRYARSRYRQRLYWQAHQWVTSPDREWPFSFTNICESLHLSPDALRARLLQAGRAEDEAA
jgi:hypothetical protein